MRAQGSDMYITGMPVSREYSYGPQVSGLHDRVPGQYAEVLARSSWEPSFNKEVQGLIRRDSQQFGHAGSVNVSDALDVSASARVMERFVVEHLASFPQDSKAGSLTPAEAVEKLKKISSGGGLWAQKMNMTVSGIRLTMANGELLKVIEEYPLEQISLCVCILDDKMFEELLIFSTELSADKVGAVHLFQCNTNQASVISEVINRSRENRARQLDHTNSIQNGSIEVAVEEPRRLVSLQPREVVPIAIDAFQQKPVGLPVGEQKKAVPYADANGNFYPLKDARISRDVEILNKCIEEVESFVLVLKRINEARRQLANMRPSKKKKEHDILMLQAQAPPEDKIIEIYRKLKHSFNLLAKLRPHITAPNAPELIHYLFIPLNVIVKVTGVEKARGVLEPLLSSLCVELLRSCLDSKEYYIWQSLGPNWTLTKQSEQFKDRYIPPYSPVFSDGWIPPEIASNEQKEAARLTAPVVVRIRSPPVDLMQDSVPSVNGHLQSSNGLPYQPRQVAIVVYDYVAHNTKELTIRTGEKVDILDNSRRWWLVKNVRGEQGYVPSTILELANEAAVGGAVDLPDARARALSAGPASPIYGKVIKNRSFAEQLPQNHAAPASVVAGQAHANGVNAHPPSLASQPSYLGIAPVVISVQLPDGSQLTTRTTIDASGQKRQVFELPASMFIPQAVVESGSSVHAPPAAFAKKASVPDQASATVPSVNQRSTSMPPPAPPPPPAVAPAVANGGLEAAKGDLQSELRNRLGRVEADVQLPLANMDNVDVFIPLFKSSTADDVARWLYKLGFSDRTINILKNKTAKDLFKMDKQVMIGTVGHDEGIQLYEELQVQNGAQTRNKTITEFQKALVKRLQLREEKQESSRGHNHTGQSRSPSALTPSDTVGKEELRKRFEDQTSVLKINQEEVDRMKQPSRNPETATFNTFAPVDATTVRLKV